MNINKIFLVISIIAPYATAMDKYGDVLSAREIEMLIDNIDTYCAKKCTIIGNIFFDCTRRCNKETNDRLSQYIMRGHINKCNGTPPETTFFYNTDELYKKRELEMTYNLVDKCRKDPKLNDCFKNKNNLFNSNISSFLRERYKREVPQNKACLK